MSWPLMPSAAFDACSNGQNTTAPNSSISRSHLRLSRMPTSTSWHRPSPRDHDQTPTTRPTDTPRANGVLAEPTDSLLHIRAPLVLVLTLGFIARDHSVAHRTDITATTLLVPGFLSFGVIVAAYGNLASTIAVLRCEGVLKRIRGTPLSPSIYLGGHLIASLDDMHSHCRVDRPARVDRLCRSPLGQRVRQLRNHSPARRVLLCRLGLALTPLIPSADAAGPVTNGTYVPLAIISGNFSANLTLPSWLNSVVSALPVKALTDGVRAGYDPRAATPSREWVVLSLWLIIGISLARRFFRWH